ncbi:hypothetical protein D9M68_623840 [compost metagenome]
MPQGQHLGQQRIGAPVSGRVAQLHQRVQAAAHGGTGNLGAMADLRDGQVALTLLEGIDHRQAACQGGHEIRIATQFFDALGRRYIHRRYHGGQGRTRIGHTTSSEGWKNSDPIIER